MLEIMKEIKGNIWDFYKKGYFIVIPTNGTVKSNGKAVMGKGLALEANQRFYGVDKELGKHISISGNVPLFLFNLRLITFPVKHNWWEKADIKLIEESAKLIAEQSKKFIPDENIYIPCVGCGNGRLDWKNVKPILEKYLNEKFIVILLISKGLCSNVSCWCPAKDHG